MGRGRGADNLRQLKQFWVSRFGGRLLQTGSMVTGSVVWRQQSLDQTTSDRDNNL